MFNREIEEEIVNLRVQNREAAIRLQCLYDETDDFMKTYYDAVGDLCQKISETEEKQKEYKKKLSGEVVDASREFDDKNFVGGYNGIRPRFEDTTKTKNNSMDKEVKTLHRKLIKIIHPDVSEEKLKAAEYTRMVNRAYNEKNYTQLVKLDQLINSGKATERDLIKQRNNLIDATFDLKIQREQVLENPLYKLMKKFNAESDNGKMFLKQIRKNLEVRATEEKRKLVELKLQYLEKMQDRITA